jgi:hypothetical protein
MKGDLMHPQSQRIVRKAVERWPDLREADLKNLEDRPENLAKVLQGKLGYSREDAEREAREFMAAATRPAS